MIEQPRRPVLDRRLEVYAYELGMHTRAEVDTLAGGKLSFVNVNADFLRRGLARKFPADLVALQIDRALAVRSRHWAELIELYEAGFLLAVDNFLIRPDTLPLLEIAGMVKFDMHQLTPDHLRVQVAALSGFPVKTIATGVDDYATYDDCKQAEIDLFQGAFFQTARFHARTMSGASHMHRLRLIAAVQNPRAELEQLDDIISTDMGVSYRLLRLINSAYFSLPQPVGTVHHALVMLGQRQVRQWTVLIALAEIDDRPAELIRTTLVRARMAELVAQAVGAESPEQHFTVGLLSLAEGLADARLEDIADELTLTPQTRAALLHREGEMGAVLGEVEAFHADRVSQMRLDREVLRDIYMQAVSWADDMYQTTRSLRKG